MKRRTVNRLLHVEEITLAGDDCKIDTRRLPALEESIPELIQEEAYKL